MKVSVLIWYSGGPEILPIVKEYNVDGYETMVFETRQTTIGRLVSTDEDFKGKPDLTYQINNS